MVVHARETFVLWKYYVSPITPVFCFVFWVVVLVVIHSKNQLLIICWDYVPGDPLGQQIHR